MRYRISKDNLIDFGMITAGCMALVIGNYFFKFTNHFVFGGVTGIAVLVADVTPFSASTVNLITNGLPALAHQQCA